MRRFYTDGWGAYTRHLDGEQHQVGKEHTQKIESKHINLRTRIKRLMRRTICFSKTTAMHDLVIGLFINRYEFGLAISHGIHTFATPSNRPTVSPLLTPVASRNLLLYQSLPTCIPV